MRPEVRARHTGGKEGKRQRDRQHDEGHQVRSLREERTDRDGHGNLAHVAQQAHSRKARNAVRRAEESADAAIACRCGEHERHAREHPGDGKRSRRLMLRRQKSRARTAERRATVERRRPEAVVEPSRIDREDGAGHGTRRHDGTHPGRTHAMRDRLEDERELQAPRRKAEQVPLREKAPKGCAKLQRIHGMSD